MRRTAKKQILEIIQTLEEALQYMKRAPENACRTMAEDCRMCTKTIADALDAEKQAEQDALAALTRFDQTLDASLAFLAKRERWIFKLSALQKQLTDVKRRIQEIKPRLEVVFLPYKASMWDSLESIWRAADADPDCDAYVVPIPYYDLNPDHTPAKFHYEGNLYPEDVPVTDYREYDLAARRPDAIYIHNPYDGYNCVTSVDPAYYSDRLKQYTDMLVYVPYFVALNDQVDEHFCQTPGVYNADRVIVQSEAVKKTYAKFIPEEKILALGSPKLDKVAWMAEHPPAMPKEWAEIAKGRKLILYNTHVSPLILDDGSVCRKLRYVFSVFEGRKDVCLLWRPHPLSEATMRAMNPEPLREYMQLIEKFKERKIGVFDDSPDVHRAIALSDMYYGDVSSLVAMYEITGKPILVQNLDLINGLYPIHFDDMEADSCYIWFIPWEINALFRIHIESGEIEFLGNFPNEKITEKYRYRSLKKFGDKLIIAPWFGDAIIEYNLIEKTFVKVPIEISFYLYKEYTGKGENLFSCIVKYKKYAIIFGSQSTIIKYDTEERKNVYYREWFNLIKDKFNKENSLMWKSYSIKNEFLFIPVMQGNFVLEFNMETGGARLYLIGKEKNRYSNIAFDGNKYWLIQNVLGEFVKWDYETGEVETYTNVEINNKNFKKNNPFQNIIATEINLLIIPYNGNKILEIDKMTGKIREYKNSLRPVLKERKNFSDEIGEYIFSGFRNNSIYILNSYYNKLVKIDKKSNIEKIYNMVFAQQLLRMLIQMEITKSKEEIFSEKNISFFLDALFSMKMYKKLIKNRQKKECGREIYRFIL